MEGADDSSGGGSTLTGGTALRGEHWVGRSRDSFCSSGDEVAEDADGEVRLNVVAFGGWRS